MAAGQALRSVFEIASAIHQQAREPLKVSAAALVHVDFNEWELVLVCHLKNDPTYASGSKAFLDTALHTLAAWHAEQSSSDLRLSLALASPNEQRGKNLESLAAHFSSTGQPWANLDGRTYVFNDAWRPAPVQAA